MATATANSKTATKTTESVEGNKGEFAPRHELAFWKPNSKKEGAAAIFQFSPAKPAVGTYDKKESSFWLSVMPETGNENGPKFDKEKTLNCKLGITDVGELLACLSGRNQGLGRLKDGKWSGLFHQNPSGNTVVKLDANEQNPGHYWLGISVQRDGESRRLSIGLTPGEQELLMVFLRTYLPQMFIN